MKRITLLTFLLLSVAFFSNAQINNGNFETWELGVSGIYNYDSLRCEWCYLNSGESKYLLFSNNAGNHNCKCR